MTDIEVARAAILDLGSADYYHLGDAAAYLPTITEDRRADVAREAMRELLNEGLVRLYFGVFATNDFEVLPLEHALRVLDDASAWYTEATYPKAYCFLNTHAGDAAYRRAGNGPNSSPDQPNATLQRQTTLFGCSLLGACASLRAGREEIWKVREVTGRYTALPSLAA